MREQVVTISSTNNPTVKYIRSLRSRKGREQSNCFWLEGIRLVAEAIQMGASLETLVVAPELLTSQFAYDLVAQQQKQGVPILQLTPRVFASLSTKDGPQGLGAVARQRWSSWPPIVAADDIWVVLEAVQDPGNLGSIMRTADAVGCAGLILVGSCTDPYAPSAVRGSMGSVFALQLAKATVEDFLLWKEGTGLCLIGTSGAAPEHYRQVTYTRPLLLVSGSEREGLSAPMIAACDSLVKLPMVGRADSLNLAIATSVVLYEIFDQVGNYRD